MILSSYVQPLDNVRAFILDILKFLQVLKEKTIFSILTTYFWNTLYISLFIFQVLFESILILFFFMFMK